MSKSRTELTLKNTAICCETFLYNCNVWVVSTAMKVQECTGALLLCDLPANHWSNLIFHINDESRGTEVIFASQRTLDEIMDLTVFGQKTNVRQI